MQEILQQINADNDIKDDNNMNSVASRERTTSNIPVGLWTPMNTSFALQHLKRCGTEKSNGYTSQKGIWRVLLCNE